MRARHDRRLVQKRLVGLVGVSLILAACSGSAASSAPAASQAAPSAAASAAAPTAAPSEPEKTLEIAYLSFAVANSYDAPMLAAAQAAAAAGNAKLTVFDANLEPPTQTKQLQDAIASGKYDGIITQPLFGAGLVEDVEKAIAAGIGVGNIDQILGADMTTAELPGRWPARERRVRAERARPQDRRARRRGVRRRRRTRATSATSSRSRPRPSTRPQEGVRRGDREPSRDQGRRRRASPSTRRRSASRPRRTCSPPTRTCRSSSAPTRPSPARSWRSSRHRGQGPARRLRRRHDRAPGHRCGRALRDRHADAGDRGSPRHRAAHRRHPDRRGVPGHGSAGDRSRTAASSPRPTSTSSCRSRSGRAESRRASAEPLRRPQP